MAGGMLASGQMENSMAMDNILILEERSSMVNGLTESVYNDSLIH